MDIILINPGDKKRAYQELGNDIAAVEPPYWIAVLARYLLDKNITVYIIDANAENLSPPETAKKVSKINPSIAAVIVYGSNPSASAQNMTIAGEICKELRKNTKSKIAIGGLHPSALPERTLKEEEVDFVIEGEGFFVLENLIPALKSLRYNEIPGLWWKEKGTTHRADKRPKLMKAENFPIAAWELLPMELYRAHNWHCLDNIHKREPYAAIYTSLGCPYNCAFCCINVPFGGPGIRFREPKQVVNEIEILSRNHGVKNLKFIDELFVLKKSHYMEIIDLLLEKNLDLNIWTYARVDTINNVNELDLDKMRRAGINWFALGIESASMAVRDGISKRMKIIDIEKIVRMVQNAGIRVIGNYIFGLPDDTMETMQETLKLAMDLNCEFANFYSAMAYPGSVLYSMAIENGWDLPNEWHGFSQYSYESLPLPTKHISAKEVLQFRDDAFKIYFSNQRYLSMVESKFGKDVKEHIMEISKDRLRRRLLE